MQRAKILVQFLLGHLGQLPGSPPLQLLFEEEQVDVDDVIQHCGGAEEPSMQSACYPTAEHILTWTRHVQHEQDTILERHKHWSKN